MSEELPPGPRGKLRASMAYTKDPYAFSAACVERYGDPFTVPLITGPVVVTGRQDGVRAFFTASSEHFDVWVREQLVPVFGERSIFVETGDAHLAHRRALGSSLRKAASFIPELIRASVEALSSGAQLDIERWCLDVSLRIILRCLLGEDDAELRELATRYVEVAARDSVLAALLKPSLQKRWYPPWVSFVKLREVLRGRLRKAVERAEPGTESVLTALLEGLGDVETVVDDLVTLLIAGHESTAHATAWAIYELHRAPEVLLALQRELDGVGRDASREAVRNLALLDAVCQETLRLHPVVVQVTRVLRKPLEISGCPVPAGVSVSPCAWLVHQDPELWPEPECFRPERFLEGDPARPSHAHVPFGGGVYRCVGASFAVEEMQWMLFHLLSRFELRGDGGEVRPVVRGLVMVPSRPIVMTLRARG